VAGEVSDYDDEATRRPIASALAEEAGVTASDVTVSVRAASVLITVHIRAANADDAQSMSARLINGPSGSGGAGVTNGTSAGGLFSSPMRLAERLLAASGVALTVEAIAQAPTPSAVTIELTSPLAPAPPLPAPHVTANRPTRPSPSPPLANPLVDSSPSAMPPLPPLPPSSQTAVDPSNIPSPMPPTPEMRSTPSAPSPASPPISNVNDPTDSATSAASAASSPVVPMVFVAVLLLVVVMGGFCCWRRRGHRLDRKHPESIRASPIDFADVSAVAAELEAPERDMCAARRTRFHLKRRSELELSSKADSRSCTKSISRQTLIGGASPMPVDMRAAPTETGPAGKYRAARTIHDNDNDKGLTAAGCVGLAQTTGEAAIDHARIDDDDESAGVDHARIVSDNVATCARAVDEWTFPSSQPISSQPRQLGAHSRTPGVELTDPGMQHMKHREERTLAAAPVVQTPGVELTQEAEERMQTRRQRMLAEAASCRAEAAETWVGKSVQMLRIDGDTPIGLSPVELLELEKLRTGVEPGVEQPTKAPRSNVRWKRFRSATSRESGYIGIDGDMPIGMTDEEWQVLSDLRRQHESPQ